MDQNILNKILENTYTFSELKKRVAILRTYLVLKHFGNQLELNERLNEQVNAQDQLWLNSLNEDFLNDFNKDNVYTVFDKIELILKQTNPLIVYLPFEVNSSLNSSLGQYMRRLFGKVVLFDIKFDPDLIAGCALSWQGIYKDYSLRKRIQDNRLMLLASFKKYPKTELGIRN